MRKSLALQIDKASWAAVPAKFRKVCPFSTAPGITDLNFLRALLWVGVSSVPVQMPLWWLASKWAIVRYIAAVDPAVSELRLHVSADALDSHHKTVLSDDWGIGIGLQWLNSQMRYKYVAHGAISMEVLRSMKVARFVKRKKRIGPFKCPDFFAVDQNDKIHLIECKGNQEGPQHIDKQFGRGRQQKTNIRFENESLVGQRLLTGVAIANPGKKWSSTIKLADPPPSEDGVYDIEAQNPIPLVESFKRVILMQGLISAGALRTAHAVFPRETRTDEIRILNDPPTTAFEKDGQKWIGQIYEELLPVPIELTDRSSITRCRMRFAAGASFLESMSIERGTDSQNEIVRGTDLELKLEKDLSGTEENNEKRQAKHPAEESVERYASLQFGNTFVADLELLER